MGQPLEHKTTLRLRKETIAALMRLAQLERITLAVYLRHLLEDHVTKKTTVQDA